MFIKAAMPRDKINQNSELLFRQTQTLGLSTAIKCDLLFRICVNAHFLFIFI
jgi:hypothetical protein